MNKKIIISLAVIAVMAAAVLLWPKNTCDAATESCGDQHATTAPQAVSKSKQIVDEVKSGKSLLLDVREPDEYAAGHAVGSTLLPLGDVEANKLNEPNKDKMIYLYCRSGRRAELAKTALEKQGYTNVENLGGLDDWQSLGGDVTR